MVDKATDLSCLINHQNIYLSTMWIIVAYCIVSVETDLLRSCMTKCLLKNHHLSACEYNSILGVALKTEA